MNGLMFYLSALSIGRDGDDESILCRKGCENDGLAWLQLGDLLGHLLHGLGLLLGLLMGRGGGGGSRTFWLLTVGMTRLGLLLLLLTILSKGLRKFSSGGCNQNNSPTNDRSIEFIIDRRERVDIQNCSIRLVSLFHETHYFAPNSISNCSA